jgi:acyl-CoA hydrolase
VEVWATTPRPEWDAGNAQTKVTEGTFVFVSIDEKGRTRPIP